VLMIAPTSFFADYGCHVRILEEARALQKLGNQVTICTYHNGRDLADVDIRRTMGIPWRTGYEVGSSRHKIGFDLLLFLRALVTMVQVKPQIIHAHLHEGALIGHVLSRLWRVPLVFDYQGSLTSEMLDHHFLSPDGPYYAPMLRLEEFIDRACPRILTSSSHAADLLVSEFRCDPGKLTHVPDCVNTTMFRPRQRDGEWRNLKRAWGIPLDRSVIVYLGLLAPYQGTDHLLRAAGALCARRDDLHFLIGGYPNVDRYQRMARDLSLGDHVTFTGRIRYEEAPRLLSLGDVAVSPKLSRTEGAGKLLNYMAMALPVVTFDTQVSHEYLGESGVYAARGDSEDLARCIEALIDAPQQALELGGSLRRRAEERFSWEAAVRAILDVYASMRA
jgi:glycosyltransferase involved in cell wall biosynthesis